MSDVTPREYFNAALKDELAPALRVQEANFISGAISREQIGTNAAKLKADSPRNFAANINIPVLMIHGDNDAQVNVEQSIAMERALSKAHKAHEFILIKGAEHSMSRESDRTTLLSAIDKFLAANLHWARTAATTEPALAWRKRARLLGFTRGALVVSSAWYAAELLAMKPCASPEWPVNTDRPAI